LIDTAMVFWFLGFGLTMQSLHQITRIVKSILQIIQRFKHLLSFTGQGTLQTPGVSTLLCNLLQQTLLLQKPEPVVEPLAFLGSSHLAAYIPKSHDP